MNIGFTAYTLAGVDIENPTSLEFGSDGRLYVSQQNGLIQALEVTEGTGPGGEPTFTVTGTENIGVVQDIPNHNDDGSTSSTANRQITGIATSSETDGNGNEAVVLYVGSSDPRISIGEDSNLDTNSGIISKLTQQLNGAGQPTGQWDIVHLVRGLPRSEENHSVNGIEIVTNAAGEAVELIVVTGGNTNNGAPSNNFSGTPEYAWANSIVRIDLQALDGFDTRTDPEGESYLVDLPTLDDPTRNFGGGADSNGSVSEVFGGNDGFNMAKITDTVEASVGGQIQSVTNPITIFSPGYRNAYDVVLTEAGNIYTVDNGPNGGWGGEPVAWENSGQGTEPADNSATVVDGDLSGGDWQTLRSTNIFNDAVGSAGTQDQLHFVGELNDAFGIYGGHANPIRASVTADPEDFTDAEIAPFLPPGVSPGNATPQELDDARSAAFADYQSKLLINYNEQTDGVWIDAGTPLPGDFDEVVEGYAWRGPSGGPSLVDDEGHSIESSLLRPTEEDALANFVASTNGLAEWTFDDAFDGELTGALIAVSFDETVSLLKLNAAGTQVIEAQVLPVDGNSPLDVVAQGEGEAFEGSFWTVQYGPDTIQAWLPSAPTTTIDTDQDDDGIEDTDDRFAGDASEGTDAVLNNGGTLVWTWEPTGQAPPGSPYEAPIDEIGFIGAFADLQTPAHRAIFGGTDGSELLQDGLITDSNWKFGGATGRVDIEVADDGSTDDNSQREATHVGFTVGDNTSSYTVDVATRNIFTYGANESDGKEFTGGERAGIYLGTGDQDNFVQILHGMVNFGSAQNPSWAPGIEVGFEVNGTYSGDTYALAGLDSGPTNGLVQFQLEVDASNGTVTPKWRSLDTPNVPEPGTGPAFTTGDAVTTSGSLQSVLTGDFSVNGKESGIALGLLATAEAGDDSFGASWEPITVTSTAQAAGAFRLEAEDFTSLDGFQVASNGNASEGQFLQAEPLAIQSIATTGFTGPSDTYDVTVGYFDENDGVSELSLIVDGTTVDTWSWDQDLGAGFATAATATTRLIPDVAIDASSVIELSGVADDGEPLRVDFLDFDPDGGGSTPGDTEAPTVSGAVANDLFATPASPVTVAITYADNEELAAASFDTNDITVTGPNGSVNVSDIAVDTSGNGTPRTVTYTLDAPGGDWDEADNGTYTIDLNGGEIEDTSANTAAAIDDLASFEVAISSGTPQAFRLEAESFGTLNGFNVVSNGVASEGAFLQAAGGASQSSATTAFSGASGTYDIRVGYFDETDGVSELSLIVNGATLDTWSWNKNLGANFASPATATVRFVPSVTINAGDEIELVGQQDGGEPLRVDFVDFEPSDGSSADTQPPSVTSVVAQDITETPSAPVTVQVTYEDDVALRAGSLDTGDISVTGPGGSLGITTATVDTGGNGSPRTVTYTLAAPSGFWDSADNGTYTIALEGDEVEDTSFNAATAVADLASFDVSISGTLQSFRIEAEAFSTLDGFQIRSNGNASSGAFLQAQSFAPESTTSTSFTGAAGTYDITVGYFDENDGVSQLSLHVDGVTIDSWSWDQDLGDAFASPQTATTRLISGVDLGAGSTIELTGQADGGEPLRVDFVDFAPGTPGSGDTQAPTVAAIRINEPAFADDVLTVEVDYLDETALDLSSIGTNDVSISGPSTPSGQPTVTTLTSTATTATVSYDFAPPSGLGWVEGAGYSAEVVAGAVSDGTNTNQASAQGFGIDFGGPQTVEALLTVLERSGIDSSTFSAGAFTVTNTGDAVIDQIEIDLGPTALDGGASEIVFDPAGEAGDSVAAPFELSQTPVDAGGDFTVVQALYDGDPNFEDDSQARQQQGYEVLTLELDGFDPGDQFTFRIDVDPTSIQGVNGSGGAGSVSGAELSGGVFSASAGGTDASAMILADGSSQGGGEALAVTDGPGSVDLTVLGQSNGGQTTSDVATPTVSVSGPANQTVRLVVLEGDVGSSNTPIDASAFEADTVRSVVTFDVDVDGSGQGSQVIDISVDSETGDNEAPTFSVVAGVLGDDGTVTGATSDPVKLRFEDSGTGGPTAFRIEAEDFTTLDGFIAQSNGNASGGQFLRAPASATDSSASTEFTGANGTYDVTVGYFDENDGVSQASFLVDGAVIDNWSWDQDLGDNFASSATKTTRVIEDVVINSDSVIEFAGQQDGGEPLRLDFLDFEPSPAAAASTGLASAPTEPLNLEQLLTPPSDGVV
ncbi:MAG: beta strand repeat-containing protein [Geminicoccaceae bacterium]